jgi:hypothetical protein
MPKEELPSYLEFLLWQYRLVDSFWFLSVEEAHGRENAEKLNENVWVRVGPLAVRDLKQRFNISEKGLHGLEKGLRLFSWTSIGNRQIKGQMTKLYLAYSAARRRWRFVL